MIMFLISDFQRNFSNESKWNQPKTKIEKNLSICSFNNFKLKDIRQLITNELSTNVKSRFFNCFPLLAGIVCKSLTARHTPITSD